MWIIITYFWQLWVREYIKAFRIFTKGGGGVPWYLIFDFSGGVISDNWFSWCLIFDIWYCWPDIWFLRTRDIWYLIFFWGSDIWYLVFGPKHNVGANLIKIRAHIVWYTFYHIWNFQENLYRTILSKMRFYEKWRNQLIC